MDRRTFVAVLLAAPALAACGSSEAVRSSTTEPAVAVTTPDSSVATPTVTAQSATPSEVVLSYTEPGGFTTAEFAFQNPPLTLITGDGLLITGAITPAVSPGPLLPQHMIRTISATGIEAVLAKAEQAGLFAEVEYVTNELIADASTATLVLDADGIVYVHQAPALGLGGLGSTESTPQSQALLDFLTVLTRAPEELAGAGTLGAPMAYEPAAYQFVATPIDDLSRFGNSPIIEEWPIGTGIELAGASDCAEVNRAAIGDLFEGSNQSTLFSENDVTYQVAARPAYPGRSC